MIQRRQFIKSLIAPAFALAVPAVLANSIAHDWKDALVEGVQQIISKYIYQSKSTIPLLHEELKTFVDDCVVKYRLYDAVVSKPCFNKKTGGLKVLIGVKKDKTLEFTVFEFTLGDYGRELQS